MTFSQVFLLRNGVLHQAPHKKDFGLCQGLFYLSDEDENGLLMDFVFQCSSPKGEGATHVTFSQDCSVLPSLKCEARWGAIQNRSPSLPLSKRDI